MASGDIERWGAAVMRLANPPMRWLFGAGVLTGPNILLTVRGRSTGLPRTFPISMMELRGRRFVQASFGETQWVRNLRVAREAIITRGARSETVEAVELEPDDAALLMHDALARYRRWGFLAWLLPHGIRPPVSISEVLPLPRR